MTDVLSQLHPASWRGLTFPVLTRDFGFQHEQSRHRFIFVKQELIEALGRQNPTYRYTIPFREGLLKGPYENLFTVVYPQFLEACVDDTDGFLVDPLHGEVQCKCVAMREIVDVDRRDGIEIEADFVVSPDEIALEDGIAADLGSVEGARGLAGAFDRDVEKINWQQEETPPTTVNFFDAISGVANQLEVAANKPLALLADQRLRFENAVESMDRLADPRNAPARARALRLQLACHDIAKQIRPVTPRGPRARVHRVQQEIGPASLAGKLGVGLSDLLRTNPQIQGKLTISGGTIVTYFA